MKSHLKVKVFALSAEMTYIRRQEAKWKNRARYARSKGRSDAYQHQALCSHQAHRYELKTEARNSHLAYGYLKGRPYQQMERICYGPLKGFGSSEPDWKAIESMVERFTKDETTPQDVMQKFAEWLADARTWYEGNKDRIKAANEQRQMQAKANAADPEYQRRKAEAAKLAQARACKF
jgi:hypothetical protein